MPISSLRPEQEGEDFELIRIIQGPTPEFEVIGPYVVGVSFERNGRLQDTESTGCYLATTRVRSNNANDLLRRCDRGWNNEVPVLFEYPGFADGGLKHRAKIVDASIDPDNRRIIIFNVVLSESDLRDLGFET